MATRRSLLPREHGAYAQLGVPLATALALHAPALAAIAFALAACFAFLANEPLLVVLGHRGARLRDSDGRRATRRLVMLVLGAVLAATVALLTGPRDAVWVAAAAAVPAAMMIAIAWRRGEHSLLGELVAVIALPGAAAPVAVASGASWQLAATLWAAWSVGYACSVFAVHRVIARHRRARTWIDLVVASGLAVTTLAACALVPRAAIASTAVPLSLLSTVLVIRPPRATRLRAIGVGLVVASAASAALALAAA